MRIRYKKTQGISQLVADISSKINEILKESFYENRLTRDEINAILQQKRNLRNCLFRCGILDYEAKNTVKAVIKELLAENMGLTAQDMEEYIAFSDAQKLTGWDKFQIILFCYEKQYGKKALIQFLQDFGFDRERSDKEFYVDEKDIDQIFRGLPLQLSEMDKLEILTQRVYSLYRGLGIADDILEMEVDGVSGGVSGNTGENKSLWVYVSGHSIQFRFLNFGSDAELERVCCNIYRHNSIGHLSKSRGYVVNDLADHSRVVVARPPFCESWVFFVRKFAHKQQLFSEDMYTGKNVEKVMLLLKILVKGCCNCAITGMQGTGKTTLLMLLISYIPPSFNLRIQELAFELHLRDIYPNRNIVTFRETPSISGQEGLDFQKKTDGSVNIIGEVASAPVAGWLMQAGQTASLFTLFTHHGKTTVSMIQSLANALLSEKLIDSEKAAVRQVARVVDFDIHMDTDRSGRRYIKRITEICYGEDVVVREIFVCENGTYIQKNSISDEGKKKMIPHLNFHEREALDHELAVEIS